MTVSFGRPSFVAPQNSGEEPTVKSIKNHLNTYAKAIHTTLGIRGKSVNHNNEQQNTEYTPASARI